MNPSTEAEYQALPIGTDRPPFSVFGNSSLSTLQKFCDRLNLTITQTMAVEDVWTRHPNRLSHQGSFFCIIVLTLFFHHFFFSSIILFHFSRYGLIPNDFIFCETMKFILIK